MRNAKWNVVWASLLLLPLSVGCSTGSSIVRGQNPDELPAGGVVQASHSQDFGAEAQYVTPVSHENYGTPMYYDCPPADCPDNNCLACKKCWPHHKHYYSYAEPQNLLYPPANTPAAMVQYPYYTVKGPSDFFMK